MKTEFEFSKNEFEVIRPHLFRFVLVLSLCIIVYVGLSLLKSKTDHELSQITGTYDSENDALRKYILDQEKISEYSLRHENIIKDGLLSPQNRLLLSGSIRSIREKHELFPVEVEMTEQSTTLLEYSDETEFPSDPVGLIKSTVEIKLPLLHEGQFISFLDEMDNFSQLLTPVKCNLSWFSLGAEALTSESANLNSSCDFQWLSFDLSPIIEDDYEDF